MQPHVPDEVDKVGAVTSRRITIIMPPSADGLGLEKILLIA